MLNRIRSAETVAAAISACAISISLVAILRRKSRKRAAEAARSPPSTCCPSHEQLRERTKIFEKRVIRIADDVLCAMGYALANSICIRGETGLIIVDTCESTEAAEECLRGFRKVEGYADLPVEGIIYTHFHTDHVSGTETFLRDSAPGCQIWAHHTTEERIRQFDSVMGPIAFVRAARQFGIHLRPPLLENCGIGPFLRLKALVPVLPVLPNRTFGDAESDFPSGRNNAAGARRTVSISGVTLELIHAPGETDDQTVVFLPSRRILLAADNYYEAFPNLYAIRGAPYRDPMKWAESLDIMRALGAEVMVPAHTLPVRGRREVASRLRNYRDAIAYVHDQTVRLALRGHHPDFAADAIRLPDALRGLEYLKEFYGTVHWSAKSIFCGYLGWFSGEPSELFRLRPSDRAKRTVALGGGPERCLTVVEESMRSGDLRWALELATAVLHLPDLPPRVRGCAMDLRVDLLRKLGEGQISANARNYYMTCALEADGAVEAKIPRQMLEQGIMKVPIEDLFGPLRYRVDVEAAGGQSRSLRVSLTDIDRSFLLVLRNSVMIVVPDSEEVAQLELGKEWEGSVISVEVSCSENAWRKFLLSPILSLGSSWLSGSFKISKGSLAEFVAFMRCLDSRV